MSQQVPSDRSGYRAERPVNRRDFVKVVGGAALTTGVGSPKMAME